MKTFWWPLLCLNTFTEVSSYLSLWTCLWSIFVTQCNMVGEQSEKVTDIATGSSWKTRSHKKGPSPLHQFVKVVMDGVGPKYEDIFLFTLNPPLHILFSYAASLLKLGRGHVTCLWRELGSGGRSWSVTATGMTDSRLPEKRCLKSAPLKLCISRHSGCEFGNTYSQATYFKSFFLSSKHK